MAPLILGTCVDLQFLLVGGFSIVLTQEKAKLKLLKISSNLSIRARLSATLSLTTRLFSFSNLRVSPIFDPIRLARYGSFYPNFQYALR